MNFWPLKNYKENYDFLKLEVEKVGQSLEKLGYEEIKSKDSTGFDQKDVHYSVNVFVVKDNGDLGVCIDAHSKIPTWLGIKPSYQFYKRKDQSVYY